MDLIKIYLIQSITSAANNLRLNAQQIEVVGLLRETIGNSKDVGSEFLKMKKSTELSKLAIRLSEIHSFLTQGKIDFVKISEQFREHSRYLIRDLNQFLENVSPQVYKNAFNKINNEKLQAINIELVDRSNLAGEIMVSNNAKLKLSEVNINSKQINDSINSFEKIILEPVKSIDEILKRMSTEKVSNEELKKISEIIEENALYSSKNNFDVLFNMHKILSSSFNEIMAGNLILNKSIIESLRACLIVIVATIKRKEVDITAYLKKAEEFGKKYIKNYSGVH